MTADQDTVLMLLAASVVAAWLASGWTTSVVLRRWRGGIALVAPRPQEPVPWRGFDVVNAVFIMLLTRIVAETAIDGAADIDLRMLAGVLSMLVGAVVVGAVLHRRGATWTDLGLTPLRPVADLRLALGGLGFVLAPLLAIAAVLNQVVPYEHPIIDYLGARSDPWAVWLVVLAAVIVAPLAEEFLFRRVLQGWLDTLEPRLFPGAAIGLSSLAFALAHAGHGLAWLPLLALGGVLGFIVRQTGSIVPAILLHALFNGVSVGLLLLQVSGLVPAS